MPHPFCSSSPALSSHPHLASPWNPMQVPSSTEIQCCLTPYPLLALSLMETSHSWSRHSGPCPLVLSWPSGPHPVRNGAGCVKDPRFCPTHNLSSSPAAVYGRCSRTRGSRVRDKSLSYSCQKSCWTFILVCAGSPWAPSFPWSCAKGPAGMLVHAGGCVTGEQTLNVGDLPFSQRKKTSLLFFFFGRWGGGRQYLVSGNSGCKHAWPRWSSSWPTKQEVQAHMGSMADWFSLQISRVFQRVGQPNKALFSIFFSILAKPRI